MERLNEESFWRLFTPFHARILFSIAVREDMIFDFEYYEGSRENVKQGSYVLLDPLCDWSAEVREGLGLFTHVETLDLNPLVFKIIGSGHRGFFTSFDNYADNGKERVNQAIFLVEPNVPEKLRPFVALHEMAESVASQHAQMQYPPSGCSETEARKWVEEEMDYVSRYGHRSACESELCSVFDRGVFFANRYANWLVQVDHNNPDNYFSQAIPEFWSEPRKKMASEAPLKLIIDFYKNIWKGQWSRNAQDQLFVNWPWMRDVV